MSMCIYFTYGLAFSKANTYVALESNVIAAGKFECVERGPERATVLAALPLAKDCGVGGAPVRVCYAVLVFNVGCRFTRLGNAATSEPAVYA